MDLGQIGNRTLNGRQIVLFSDSLAQVLFSLESSLPFSQNLTAKEAGHSIDWLENGSSERVNWAIKYLFVSRDPIALVWKHNHIHNIFAM